MQKSYSRNIDRSYLHYSIEVAHPTCAKIEGYFYVRMWSRSNWYVIDWALNHTFCIVTQFNILNILSFMDSILTDLCFLLKILNKKNKLNCAKYSQGTEFYVFSPYNLENLTLQCCSQFCIKCYRDMVISVFVYWRIRGIICVHSLWQYLLRNRLKLFMNYSRMKKKMYRGWEIASLITKIISKKD